MLRKMAAEGGENRLPSALCIRWLHQLVLRPNIMRLGIGHINLGQLRGGEKDQIQERFSTDEQGACGASRVRETARHKLGELNLNYRKWFSDHFPPHQVFQMLDHLARKLR